MSTQQPFYSPKFRAFDANGDPLAGGLLYSYAAETSTPLDTYTTRAGDIANTNPVELDANGEADVWTTPGVLYKFVLADSDDVIQWTVDNVPSSGSSSGGGGGGSGADAVTVDPGLRLTSTSGFPVTQGDHAGVSTIFYTPYTHNKLPLYDGSAWALHTVDTELSQALSDATKSPAAATGDSVYDMFVWEDAGTLRLSRGPAWASPASSRGTGGGTTELERVGGRYVNMHGISNGPAAQRGLYVGTIRVSTVSGGVDDTMASRHVWNAYNRVQRPMAVTEATATWTYPANTLAPWRQANNAGGNQLDFVVGLPGEPVRAEVQAHCYSTTSFTAGAGAGIGIDSATVNGATTCHSLAIIPAIPLTEGLQKEDAAVHVSAAYEGFPGIGRHFLAWLECAHPGGGTTVVTWVGTQDILILGPPAYFRRVRSGITGHVFA